MAPRPSLPRVALQPCYTWLPPPLPPSTLQDVYLALLSEEMLRPLVLPVELLDEMGYPKVIDNSSMATVWMQPAPWLRRHQLDADAPTFSPGASYRDMRACSRCRIMFNTRSEVHPTPCVYHWGRTEEDQFGYRRHTCCYAPVGSSGCASVSFHVHQSLMPGQNGPLQGYVQAQSPRGGVFALDAEMIYTTAGMELASIAIIDVNGNAVYQTFVRPEEKILDCNTMFSGIRPEDVLCADKSLKDVQSDILKFVGSDTILVGHSLDNDLRALKFIHGTVIDTSALYPDRRGLPFRRALRDLTKEYLGREIQQGQEGHAPVEDARAALELALLVAEERLYNRQR
ncbi:exonuclease GOR-like [Choristoneura fumiferana]|uniref:exonuclease GOR-like n=1 Tax=Choristoneura fumiferana TaxID=7141 RepID=UPI003D15576E